MTTVSTFSSVVLSTSSLDALLGPLQVEGWSVRHAMRDEDAGEWRLLLKKGSA